MTSCMRATNTQPDRESESKRKHGGSIDRRTTAAWPQADGPGCQQLCSDETNNSNAVGGDSDSFNGSGLTHTEDNTADIIADTMDGGAADIKADNMYSTRDAYDKTGVWNKTLVNK